MFERATVITPGRVNFELRTVSSLPGPSLVAQAEMFGMTVEQAAIEALVQPTTLMLQSTKKLAGRPVACIPGQVLGSSTYGPHKSEFMYILKGPSESEVQERRPCAGKVGELLHAGLSRYGLPFEGAYATYLTRFMSPYPKTKLPSAWIKECLYLLQQEIEIVDPKYIICFGADPVKALFGKVTLRSLKGEIREYSRALVGATNSPFDVLRDPDALSDFLTGIRLFACSALGTIVDAEPKRYEYVKTLDRWLEICQEFRDHDKFAIDCEWRGESPISGKLMTIQFSPRARESYVLCLWLPQDNFELEGRTQALMALRDLLCRPGVRVCGHNFRADMQWLTHHGINLEDAFEACGFDTMLASHLLEETAEHNLTSVMLRHTDMARYDAKVDEYLAAGVMHYQMPTDVLLPYAAADTDATFRLWEILEGKLWDDHVKRCSELAVGDPYAAVVSPNSARAAGVAWVNSLYNLARFIVFPVNLAISDMETNGLLVDRERLVSMIEQFAAMSDQLAANFREVIGEPDFNLNSPLQVQRLLFADPNFIAEDGIQRTCLGLRPIKCSGTDRPWDELEAKRQVWYEDGVGWKSNQFSPSTDAESLAQLAEKGSYEAELLRDYRFVEQICKNFLRDEEEDKHTGLVDYLKGLLGMASVDGRIHTHISQLTETGRWRSARPNCQNLPKGREADLQRIFGDKPVPAVRSAILPSEGCLLMEGDFSSAEIWTLGAISKDPAMNADLRKRMPDGEFISLHTTVAIEIFKLPVTEEEFEYIRKNKKDPRKLEYGKLRTVAKSVNFGIPYQRGGAAIARAVQREGVDCTERDGKDWVASWYDRYVVAGQYIDFCKSSVTDPGYIRMPWGRIRHFTPSVYEDVLAAQQREACNAPIQGTVADSLSYALVILRHKLRDLGLKTKILLAVHDAVLLDVPYNEIAVVKHVLHHVMTQEVEVPGCNLRYSADIEICARWCEAMETKAVDEFLSSRGVVPLRLAG